MNFQKDNVINDRFHSSDGGESQEEKIGNNRSLIYKLTHPNPLCGIFTLGQINRQLHELLKDGAVLTQLDKDLITGMIAMNNESLGLNDVTLRPHKDPAADMNPDASQTETPLMKQSNKLASKLNYAMSMRFSRPVDKIKIHQEPPSQNSRSHFERSFGKDELSEKITQQIHQRRAYMSRNAYKGDGDLTIEPPPNQNSSMHSLVNNNSNAEVVQHYFSGAKSKQPTALQTIENTQFDNDFFASEFDKKLAEGELRSRS